MSFPKPRTGRARADLLYQSVFMRALSLHLQICWQVVTGRKFFIGAQLFGWGIPAILVAASLAVTGVSFRFGDTCHINHRNGLQVFWAPLLTFAAAAIVVQFATYVLVSSKHTWSYNPGANIRHFIQLWLLYQGLSAITHRREPQHRQQLGLALLQRQHTYGHGFSSISTRAEGRGAPMARHRRGPIDSRQRRLLCRHLRLY